MVFEDTPSGPHSVVQLTLDGLASDAQVWTRVIPPALPFAFKDDEVPDFSSFRWPPAWEPVVGSQDLDGGVPGMV